MANTKNEVKRIRVKNTTGVPGLAQAIEHEILQNGSVVLLAVGASAVNQAVKGAARACDWAAHHGKHYYIVPSFEHGEPAKDHVGEGQQTISRISLRVEVAA